MQLTINHLSLKLLLCLLSFSLYQQLHAQAPTIEGELRVWHRISLTFDGPNTSEVANPNPFSDYRLAVTFSREGGNSYTVPGFYAADGDAAETSADTGNKWRVYFAPDQEGTWTYNVSFTTGTDVAIDGGGSSAGFMDGYMDSFTVLASNKTGKDHRAKGRLQYVGEHYLQYATTGEWFVKAGADAPENTLAYDDFDEVPNKGNRRKSWSPHQQDYIAAEAEGYTWQNGKGTELLGVINYLSTKNVNAFSFLTFSLEGDDDNVFPHRLLGTVDDYNNTSNNTLWENAVYQDRFDVSRMAQWERIFAYADQKGIFLHFKTQETENDHLMDGGDVGRERKLYYRELIARYSHHLALNWNMGEENTQSTQQRKDMAEYFAQNDPYQHLRVIHTYPGQKNSVYSPLLGSDSEYTGASLQTSNQAFDQVFNDTEDWLDNSADASKKWVIAVDEPGSAQIGTDADPDDRKLIRHKVVWAQFMAGGAGTEFYYGYGTGCTDLDCEDHRTRDEKYTDAALALQFFQSHFQPFLPEVSNVNELTSATDDYVLAKPGNAYALYLPDGGSTNISLPSGTWQIQWYNPRNGEMGAATDISGSNISAPDVNDWAALILPTNCTAGNSCNDGNACTINDIYDINCNCAGVFQDSDLDGVCDADDACPGFDDNLDADSDGLPDDCDNCDGNLAGTPCDDGDPETSNDSYTSNCECVGVPPGGAADFWLEAECASYGSNWQSQSNALASNGMVLTTIGTETFLNSPPTDISYSIRFSIAVSTPGSYKIFSRAITTGDGDDSFWVRANCGSWVQWNKINFPYDQSDFVWEQAANWTGGDNVTTVTFELSTGVNIIEFAFREPGILFDKIYGTLDMEAPVALGLTANNCSPSCSPGSSCDDGDPMTENDVYDDNCSCAGSATSCNLLLPVDWLDFQAHAQGKDVLLRWATASETDNAYFEVEYSNHQSSFAALEQVAATGNSTETQNYQYLHLAPGPGHHYYRIKQVDYSGSFSYSPIRSVQLDVPLPIIFPNPTRDQIRVENFTGTISSLQLWDVHGRLVRQFPDLLNSGQSLSLAGLAPGVYLLNGQINGDNWSQRVVKQE